MAAIIIDGTATAKNIREELSEEVVRLKKQHDIIRVWLRYWSEATASVICLHESKTCKAMGLHSENYDLPAKTTEEELLSLIDRLNKEPKIHGILVQVPFPHIHENTVLAAINPLKM